MAIRYARGPTEEIVYSPSTMIAPRATQLLAIVLASVGCDPQPRDLPPPAPATKQPARAFVKREGAGSTSGPDLSPGAPLPGLAPEELARFQRGRAAFERTYDIETGLGPVYSDDACNNCHNLGGVGGGGFKSARLVGRGASGSFDALVAFGGPILASSSVTLNADAARLLPDCRLSPGGEARPAQANLDARRRTPPLFGLGLVEATPTETLEALARAQPPTIRGRVAPPTGSTAGGLGSGAVSDSIGKFGWKAESPSLHHFAGLALLTEMGITSPEFPEEQPPSGDRKAIAPCDRVSQLEADAAAVRELVDFMQWLAPVPPTPSSSAQVVRGDTLFTELGCDGCHVRRLRSGPHPSPALSNRDYFPYSDFLLHDMGSLGDGMVSEAGAGPREMRTAPLWGGRLLVFKRLLHDGRARSFAQAIEQHDGQAAEARNAFLGRSQLDRDALLAFLETL